MVGKLLGEVVRYVWGGIGWGIGWGGERWGGIGWGIRWSGEGKLWVGIGWREKGGEKTIGGICTDSRPAGCLIPVLVWVKGNELI